MRARILARAAELCRKVLESPMCSCSHMRRGRSLLDRSIGGLFSPNVGGLLLLSLSLFTGVFEKHMNRKQKCET